MSSIKTLEKEMDRLWPTAQTYWSRFLLLNDPEVNDGIKSVAQISLGTRQVSLNHELMCFKT